MKSFEFLFLTYQTKDHINQRYNEQVPMLSATFFQSKNKFYNQEKVTIEIYQFTHLLWGLFTIALVMLKRIQKITIK